MKQIKKALAVVLSLAMVLGTLTVTAFGAVTEISNYNGLSSALSSGGEVKLTTNITNISTDRPFTISSGVNLTIDLNGHVLGRNTSAGVILTNNGTLTIKDTSEDGDGYIGYLGDVSTASTSIQVTNNGTINIVSGGFGKMSSSATYGVIRNNGTINMSGGFIKDLTNSEGDAIYNGKTDETPEINVTGGEISNITYGSSKAGINVASGATLSVSGSDTKIGTSIRTTGTPSGTVSLSGGWFSTQPTASWIADGYAWKADTTTVSGYAGKVAPVTVKVTTDGTTTGYADLVDAVGTIIENSSNVTATIKLLADQDLGTTRLDSRYNKSADSVRNLTFDLNGKTITYSGTSSGWIQISNASTFVVKNGTIDTGNKQFIGSAKADSSGSTITLENLTWNTTGSSWQFGNQTIEITSGQYKLDPSSYVNRSTYAVSGPDASGYYTVTDDIAASVTSGGNTYVYASLEDAWAAAIAVSEATVTLNDNVTIASALTDIPSTSAITLNLNGKTITSTEAFTTVAGSLTVQDSSTGGSISYSGTDTLITVNGTFALNSGTINAANGTAISAGNDATATISGGKVLGTMTTAGTGSITVTGGTFDHDPSSYINKTTYTVTGPTDGLYTVSTDYSVTVNNGTSTKIYATLESAWADAIQETTALVTVLNDVSLSDALNNIPNSCDLTLNLNGKTITCEKRFVRTYGDFIIEDSSAEGTGKILYNGSITTTDLGFIQVAYSSTNGTGTFTLNSGTIEMETKWPTNGVIASTNDGSNVKITINGGTIKTDTTASPLPAISVGNAKATVTGGTVYGVMEIRTGKNGSITVTGGTFDHDPTEFVDTTQYYVQQNTPSTGLYTVIEAVASVTINEVTTSYASFTAAWTDAIAASEATVKVLNDVSLANNLTDIPNLCDLTLDLNGKTITCEKRFVRTYGDFVVEDSSAEGTGKILYNGVVSTSDYGFIQAAYSSTAGTGTFTLNSGTIEMETKWPTNGVIASTNDGSYVKITINGGTIKTDTTASPLPAISVGNAKATVTGGTVYGVMEIRTGKKGSITVTGGTFDHNPSTYVDQDKYSVQQDTPSAGLYTVAKYVASVTIGETTNEYTSLESAFAAIDGESGAVDATIKLLSDITVDNRIATIDKTQETAHNITLNLYSHKITYTGTSNGLVLLKAYNNLTITDSSSKEGGEIDASASSGSKTIIATNNYSTATFEKGTFRGNYISYTSYRNLSTIKGGLYYFDPSNSTSGSETKFNIIEGKVITLEEGKYTVGVCRIGDKGYATLHDAVADAVNNDTIVICSNIVLTSPLLINTNGGVDVSVKNLTFTDDGQMRRIDLKMSNVSTSGGIVIGAGKTVNFEGTATDNLRIRGYGEKTGKETENTYCDKPAIAMATSNTGVLNLTNVRMIYCKPTRKAETSNGGAIYNPNALNTVNIDGCSFENNQATYGSVVYSNGTLNITNSAIGKTNDTEYSAANVSTKGGTIYNAGSGTVTISNTSIIYNKANRGAAIYNSGASANINLGANTVITKNKSESAGGAIYFYSKSENTGKIYLNGTGIQVTGNKENTVIKGQDDSGDKEVEGKDSNIHVKNMDSIIVTGDISGGNIGLNFINSTEAADLLPVTASGYTFDQDDSNSLKCDANSNLKAYVRTTSAELPYVALWGTYQYSVTVGNTITRKGSTFKYQLNDVSVSQDPYQNASVISIVVDSGSFTIPWSRMNETLKNRIVRISTLDTGDTLYNSGDTEKEAEIKLPTDESKEYKAITIYVNEENRLTNQEIIDFVKLPIYEVESNAVAQKIYVGLQPEFIPSSDADAQGYYFAGGFYTYHSTMNLRWSEADNDATSRGAHLVTINSAIENSIVHAILGKNAAWLGAIKIYDSWYWQRGFWAGTKITGNTTTTEGYNGAYTNFANTDPFCDVTFGRLYMTNAGKWKEADGESTTDDGGKSIGYLGMLDDEYSKVPVASINMTRTDKDVLTAVSADYEDGLEMSYYFTFSDTTKADATAKVKIKIGELPATEILVSSIIAGEATVDGDYKITVPVMPKCMADKVTISIVKNSGLTEVKYGSGDGYNLQYYAYKAIVNNEENESDVYTRVYSNDFSAMAQALLHYGSAAQSQFGWNIIHLADAAISETHPASAVPTDTEFLNNKASGTFTQGTTNTITSVALVSDSTTGLRIYYTGNAASISVNGGAKTYTPGSEGGENYIQFSIASKDLSRFYTAQIGDASCQLNAYYVIKQIMDYSSSTPEARTTAYRLYEFGEVAATYFGAYKASVDRQYALINTAFAYLQKSEFVDYDQKQMTDGTSFSGTDNPRRQIVVTPEDASAAQKVYMDCSSFVYDIYNITFGSEAAQRALGYDEVETNPTVTTAELIKHSGVYTAGQADNSVKLEEQDGGLDKIYADLREELQPGDLIVKYRYQGEKSAHGHVAVWVGDGFIHCTGSSYSYAGAESKDKVDDNAIFYVPNSELEQGFGLEGFHYIKILRPLKYMADNDIAITAQGTARQQIGETGFDVYGTRTNGEILYNGQGVKVGETIRYVIDIDNEKRQGEFNIDREFNYEFTLPSGVTFTSATDGGTLVGNTIKWTDISVPANTKKQITFDVVVNNDYEQDDFGNNVIKYAEDAGKATLCSPGSDAEVVSMSCINTPVEATDESAETILSTIRAYRDETETPSSYGLSLVNSIYNKTAFSSVYDEDIDLFRGTSGNSFTGLVRYYNGSFLYLMYITNGMTSNVCFNYLASNLIGGQRVKNSSSSPEMINIDHRARSFTTNNLMEGDVVACANFNNTWDASNMTYTYYIYLGADEDMLQINSDSVTTAKPAEVMDKLLGAYDIFAVLRFLGR